MTPSPSPQETATVVKLDPSRERPPARVEDKLQALREIIVGEEFESLESRYQKLEQGIEARTNKERNDVFSELEALQHQTKSEIKGVGDMVVEMVQQLQAEDSGQAAQLEKIGQRLTALETHGEGVKEVVEQQLRAMREEFGRQMAALSANMKARQEAAMRQAVPRADLVKLLSGLAGGLAVDDAAPEEDAANEA